AMRTWVGLMGVDGSPRVATKTGISTSRIARRAASRCYPRAMFERILIARRGAAAASIARSLRRLDREAVALVLSASEEGVHVEACDDVFIAKLGPSGEIDFADLAARAKEQGIGAVHPGWSDARDAALREACEAAELTYL